MDPAKLTKDERFLSKLVTSSVKTAYTMIMNFNFSQNKEICL